MPYKYRSYSAQKQYKRRVIPVINKKRTFTPQKFKKTPLTIRRHHKHHKHHRHHRKVHRHTFLEAMRYMRGKLEYNHALTITADASEAGYFHLTFCRFQPSRIHDTS